MNVSIRTQNFIHIHFEGHNLPQENIFLQSPLKNILFNNTFFFVFFNSHLRKILYNFPVKQAIKMMKHY